MQEALEWKRFSRHIVYKGLREEEVADKMHLVTKQTNINDREVERDIMDMMMEGQGWGKAVRIIAAGIKGELNMLHI